MAVLAELDLQLFHFVVMEILLDQVALSLNPGPHVRGNIRNHPGHKELYQEDHMLPRKKAGQVGSTSELHEELLHPKMYVSVGGLLLI